MLDHLLSYFFTGFFVCLFYCLIGFFSQTSYLFFLLRLLFFFLWPRMIDCDLFYAFSTCGWSFNQFFFIFPFSCLQIKMIYDDFWALLFRSLLDFFPLNFLFHFFLSLFSSPFFPSRNACCSRIKITITSEMDELSVSLIIINIRMNSINQ
jgi:hypothetical protein